MASPWGTTLQSCLGRPGAGKHFNKQKGVRRLQEAEYMSSGRCLIPHHAQDTTSVERGCVSPPGVLEDQHSLLLLLSCPMIKCPRATTNVETQWLKCRKSVCLDKRARLDSLERLSNLESNDPTLSRHTSVKATCRVK